MTDNTGSDDPTSSQGASAAGETPAADGKDDSSGAETPAPRKGSKLGAVKELAFLVAIGVATAFLLQSFVIKPFWIPSESMENTLLVGDRVIVNRLDGDVERGDVVVFKGWDGADTIKRVIGKGGDAVKCCDDKRRITVNGHPLDEEAYLYPGDYPSDPFEVKVPQGRLWLMGDHRSQSVDSRDHHEYTGDGSISEDDVTGRAFAIFWPLSRATFLSTPETFTKLP
ncbi:signal peptidase I [Sinosporangium album]|uniref:Signal peptidase I n=1 Tax=Sinosporangium album TaxID=504805 RepID=A0A1G7VEJ4_9ACTN|nr:signal peptidase I [Sinosporangium album]SDG57978.1 signal peptidase I [Sinosporangium album]